MATWEEIKRLAADFQRTQESDTLQRLSERNCIDLVKKIVELNLIELIYTCDGKEFVTPEHLLREIEDEVYACGGRVHLHDLAAKLNVDYQHVENKAKDLVRERPEYNLILGQMIHSDYKKTLGQLIQDTMLEHGQLNIADFAKTLDLPSDFLLTIVQEVMQTVIDDFVVSQDGRTYYTSEIMGRYKAIVAGTLTAISKPTTLASIMKRLGLSERLFTPIVDGLIKEGRILATIENKVFIPSIYLRERNEWVDKFYESNSYVGYDVLSRMDIKQPKAFLKKRYLDGLALKTCFVGPSLSSQVEALIEDTIATNGWIDIGTIIPPAIQPEDVEMLIGDIFKKCNQFSTSSFVFNQTILCSAGFITSCKESLANLMPKTAQAQLKEGTLMSYFLTGKPCDKRKSKNPARKAESEKTNQDHENKSQDDDQCKSDVISDGHQHEKSQTESRETKNDKDHTNETTRIIPTNDTTKEESVKKSKSRKSGGGSQGREIKQKAVKKKYMPGNRGARKVEDDSDDEQIASNKASRSKKGRAARRAVSPERPLQPVTKEVALIKEPLTFMSAEEIAESLKKDSPNDESLGQLMDRIAEKIETDLNKAYEIVARKTLDDYLKSQNDKENEEQCSDAIDSEVEVIA